MTSQDTSGRFPLTQAALSRPRNRSGNAASDNDRLARLIGRLPDRWRRIIGWLRRPSARWARVPAGLLFMVGGVFAILPVLGLWMIPLGLILLAEDVAPLRRLRDRLLGWLERRRPHWFAENHSSSSKEGTP